MLLQGTEQFHDFLSKTLRAFRPANFVPQESDVLGSRYLPRWLASRRSLSQAPHSTGSTSSILSGS
jgi:hypothetical protein